MIEGKTAALGAVERAFVSHSRANSRLGKRMHIRHGEDNTHGVGL